MGTPAHQVRAERGSASGFASRWGPFRAIVSPATELVPGRRWAHALFGLALLIYALLVTHYASPMGVDL